MKKTLRLAFLLFSALCSAQGMAQTFQAVPAPLLESEVAFNQANECIIHFDHPAGTPLQLRWRRLEMSLPNGWDADLCDYGLCYNGVPPNGTMNPITGVTQAYLKLIVLPDNVPGVGWFWFRAYEMGNDSNFVDVYFSLHTPGTVGTALPVWTSTDVHISPNPAREVVFLENNTHQSIPVRLWSAAGTMQWAGELPPRQKLPVQVGDWPRGLYFLQEPGGMKRLVLH